MEWTLFAVELRTWFRNIVGIDITVFDILGNKSIAELAVAMAPKSEFLSESLRMMSRQVTRYAYIVNKYLFDRVSTWILDLLRGETLPRLYSMNELEPSTTLGV
jgi:hypothetical protein